MDLEILRIASEDNNNKYIQNHTHHSKLKNPLCGDEMQINLIIDKERIIDFQHPDSSLPSSIDCVSVYLVRSQVKSDIHNFSKGWINW